MKVYLAGAINGQTDAQAKGWRDAAKELISDTIDPMDRDYRGRENEAYREIVELDKADIDSVDALLVKYVSPSVGTSMEILYAFEHRKIIVLIRENDEGNFSKAREGLSPWLLYHVTAIFPSLPFAANYLKSYADNLARYGCCSEARLAPCVCMMAISCPIHGERHYGTHD